MQAQDPVPLTRQHVPHVVGQRVVTRRSQQLRHRDVATDAVETRGLAGVGDDGQRRGVAGLHPAARHGLADDAELPRELPHPRLAGVAPDDLQDRRIRHLDRRRLRSAVEHLHRHPPPGRPRPGGLLQPGQGEPRHHPEVVVGQLAVGGGELAQVLGVVLPVPEREPNRSSTPPQGVCLQDQVRSRVSWPRVPKPSSMNRVSIRSLIRVHGLDRAQGQGGQELAARELAGLPLLTAVVVQHPPALLGVLVQRLEAPAGLPELDQAGLRRGRAPVGPVVLIAETVPGRPPHLLRALPPPPGWGLQQVLQTSGRRSGGRGCGRRLRGGDVGLVDGVVRPDGDEPLGLGGHRPGQVGGGAGRSRGRLPPPPRRERRPTGRSAPLPRSRQRPTPGAWADPRRPGASPQAAAMGFESHGTAATVTSVRGEPCSPTSPGTTLGSVTMVIRWGRPSCARWSRLLRSLGPSWLPAQMTTGPRGVPVAPPGGVRTPGRGLAGSCPDPGALFVGGPGRRSRWVGWRRPSSRRPLPGGGGALGGAVHAGH